MFQKMFGFNKGDFNLIKRTIIKSDVVLYCDYKKDIYRYNFEKELEREVTCDWTFNKMNVYLFFNTKRTNLKVNLIDVKEILITKIKFFTDRIDVYAEITNFCGVKEEDIENGFYLNSIDNEVIDYNSFYVFENIYYTRDRETDNYYAYLKDKKISILMDKRYIRFKGRRISDYQGYKLGAKYFEFKNKKLYNLFKMTAILKVFNRVSLENSKFIYYKNKTKVSFDLLSFKDIKHSYDDSNSIMNMKRYIYNAIDILNSVMENNNLNKKKKKTLKVAINLGYEILEELDYTLNTEYNIID